MTRKYYVLPIFLVLFTASIVPFSYASVESEAQEDLMAGCRDGQTLVYRFAYLDYVCVEPSTAQRWVELKMAEIVQESSKNSAEESVPVDQTYDDSEFPGAPPPPPKKPASDVDSVCRDDQVLILKLSYSDIMCANLNTAKQWERLGIAEIIEDLESFDKKSQFVVEDEMDEIEFEEEPVVEPSKCELLQASNSNITPNFMQKNNATWIVSGSGVVNSAFIEGDDGIIAINTLNCYDIAKQSLEKLRTITEKPIKLIIFTSVSEELVDGSRAYLEEGDENVEFIIHENLLESLTFELDSEDQTVHTFASRFGIDVSGIELKIIHVDDGYPGLLYIHLSQTDDLLIGNVEDGVYPFLIHPSYFQ